MAKRSVPHTSREAHDSIKPMKEGHWGKILEALKELGRASAEQVAKHLGMQHSQINRRFSELHAQGLIFNTGLKVPTSTGRSAYQWSLIENQQVEINTVEKMEKGVKSTTDYANEIIKSCSKPPYKQSGLWE